MEERIQKRYRALLKRVDKNGNGVISKDGEYTNNFFSIILFVIDTCLKISQSLCHRVEGTLQR